MKSILVAALATVLGTFASNTYASPLEVSSETTVVRGARTQVKMEIDVQRATTAPGELDILFVIDDSGSMTSHQAKLLSNIGELVRAAQASGVDIRAAVINTNVDSPPWTPVPGVTFKGEFIGSGKKVASTVDGDFEAVLTENLKLAMNTNGSGQEQPFEAVRLALTEPLLSGANKDFLRQGSALAVFVLTDGTDESPMTSAEFVTFLRGLPTSNMPTFHAAYIPTASIGATCSASGQAAPTKLEEVMKEFGTLQEAADLCDADFGTKLATIGSKYEGFGVHSVEFQLEPVLSTLKVTYGSTSLMGGNLHGGWIYDSREMLLKLGRGIKWMSEPAGTKLMIEYTAK